jgi:hypothetical protein
VTLAVIYYRSIPAYQHNALSPNVIKYNVVAFSPTDLLLPNSKSFYYYYYYYYYYCICCAILCFVWRHIQIMSLTKDDQGGNNGGGLSDLQTGSDTGGLVAGLMGYQQQQSGNGLQSQDGNDANNGSGMMGGIGMMGGQGGLGDLDGQQGNNSLLAQQQALMAMAAGGGGADNGSNKDALMNLLAKQGE